MIHNLPITAGMASVCLSINYNGFHRIVEIHTVGKSKAGHKLMRVWQVRGGSSSGVFEGWKLMRLDQVTAMALTEENSQAPRDGYRRGDKAMAVIDWQI
jgi:hypothetical protein